MSLFSFYRSAFFEEAFISHGRWRSVRERVISFLPFITFSRRYVILEDLLEVEQSFRVPAGDRGKSPSTVLKTTGIEFPQDYTQLAELYLRFKAAADNAKDYQLASWFYFNEFEMKRRALFQRDPDKTLSPMHALFLLTRPDAMLYSCYRVLAGYGEKPIWSLLWFSLFSVMFAAGRLLNGFTVISESGRETLINYDLCVSSVGWETVCSLVFWKHFAAALSLTLYRVLPATYLPDIGLGVQEASGTAGDILFSLANTVVLVILVVFMGIGLKRHFRRF